MRAYMNKYDICGIFASTRIFFFVKEVGVYFSQKKEDYSPPPALVTSGGEYLLAHAHTHTRIWGRTTYYHVSAFFF